MFYDERVQVYQDDKGIFINRDPKDKTEKYVYEQGAAVCHIAIAKDWELLVRCDMTDNRYIVQLKQDGKVYHKAQPDTLDMLNGFTIPWCFYSYYNYKNLEAREKGQKHFGGAESIGDSIMFALSCLVLIIIGNYWGGVWGVLLGVVLTVGIVNIVRNRAAGNAELAGYYAGRAASVRRYYKLDEAEKPASEPAVESPVESTVEPAAEQ